MQVSEVVMAVTWSMTVFWTRFLFVPVVETLCINTEDTTELHSTRRHRRKRIRSKKLHYTKNYPYKKVTGSLPVCNEEPIWFSFTM